MNWYKNIKIAASPKNIVNNWKVDDPFLKFFVYTYEPLIDLSKIKSKEDLQIYIKNKLIPDLQSKIDVNNPKGYYRQTMTDQEAITELNDHEMDPRVQQAISIFKEDPKTAKKILLKATNEDKKISFDRWWEYMSEHSDSPAFFYSMLNPIIESSPASQKNGPPPANRKAIALIRDDISNKGVTQMNVFKKFVKNSFKLDKESEKNTDGIIDVSDDKQWIRVDSKLKDPKNYKNNQEKLMRFATDSGWCIAQNHYSNEYLSKGDFWLYFENQKPKIAIRLTGNSDKGENKVAEIRGLHNKQENLEPYWEPVTTFLHNTNFDYANNEHYKIVRNIMEKNVNLQELEQTDPVKFKQIYNNFLESIQEDPKQIGQISKENKYNYPELVKASANGYERILNKLLNSVENISSTGNEYQNRFSHFQDEYNNIPDEVKPYISNDIERRLVSVHKKAFMRNPLEYEFFPPEMKKVITLEDKKESWTNYVGNDPYRYNDTRMDEMGVRKYIPIKPILDGWVRLVNRNIDHAYNIPNFILNIKNAKGQRFFPENYIENKIVEDFKKYPCDRTSKGYEKLNQIQQKGLLTEEQIAQTYADFITRNANNPRMKNPMLYVPTQYRDMAKNNLTDITPLANKYYQQVMSNAEYFNTIDDQNIRNTLLNDNRYRQGIINSFNNLREKSYGNDWNGFWVDLPEDVKTIMPDSIVDAVANLWMPHVQQNPMLMDPSDNTIDDIIKNSISRKIQPQINQASIRNWYKRRLS